MLASVRKKHLAALVRMTGVGFSTVVATGFVGAYVSDAGFDLEEFVASTTKNTQQAAAKESVSFGHPAGSRVHRKLHSNDREVPKNRAKAR
jgi:hypothetical protein